MSSLDFDTIAALKPGDVFYECEMGLNIRARVATAPVIGTGQRDRRTLKWKAENTENGEPIEYLLTENLDHYGPYLYREPQYCRIVADAMVFPLYGAAEPLPSPPEGGAA